MGRGQGDGDSEGAIRSVLRCKRNRGRIRRGTRSRMFTASGNRIFPTFCGDLSDRFPPVPPSVVTVYHHGYFSSAQADVR